MPFKKILNFASDDWIESMSTELLEFYEYLIMGVNMNLKKVKYENALDILKVDYLVESTFHNMPNPDDGEVDPSELIKQKMEEEKTNTPDFSQLDDESIKICHKLIECCKTV